MAHFEEDVAASLLLDEDGNIYVAAGTFLYAFGSNETHKWALDLKERSRQLLGVGERILVFGSDHLVVLQQDKSIEAVCPFDAFDFSVDRSGKVMTGNGYKGLIALDPLTCQVHKSLDCETQGGCLGSWIWIASGPEGKTYIHVMPHGVDGTMAGVDYLWVIGPSGQEEWIFVKIPEKPFEIEMPDDWDPCSENEDRPTVTLGWDSESSVRAPFGIEVSYDPIPIELEGEEVVVPIPDRPGIIQDGYVILPAKTLEIPADEVPIPGETVVIEVDGAQIPVEIPEVTLEVENGYVTIPERKITVPADQIVIPDQELTLTIEDQELTVVVPGGTYTVSNQTVTIPDRTITIPGWSQTIERVPDLSIETVLTLTYSFGAFDVTSISKFTDDGFVSQKFKISGEFGPASLSGYMEFDPSVPTYVKSWLKGTLDFAGVSLTGKVTHKPNEMHYYLTAEVDPVTVKLSFVDYCTGIEFDNVLVSLDDLSFCCGITYDASLYFTKEGFEYVKFTVDSLFDLCCGISFGAGVEFGLDYKKLSLDVNWAGIENCITVYGDVQWEEELNKVAGLDIYGWKIVCELAECTKLEILTALDPTYKKFKNIFEGDEFEYIKASFCGPGCCGGSWNFDSTIFFQPSGTLFGITRVKLNFTFPVMDSLTVKFGGEVPENSFSFGWSLTF